MVILGKTRSVSKLISSSIFCLFIFISPFLSAQTRSFGANDDFIRVKQGDVVNINIDTAYVISSTRAKFINKKLDELKDIQHLYNDLVDNRNELLNELKKTHKVLTKLLAHLEGDSTLFSENVTQLIDQLDNSLADLKNNNETLKKNNTELKNKIEQLQRLVGDLKKETRGIWWNGVADKIVVFAGGVGIGILIMAII